MSCNQTAFEAQGKLLGSANQKIFELETKIKETAHKVDRLRDYERQIEQLVQMQKLWWVARSLEYAAADSCYFREMDTRKLNEQTQLLTQMQSEYQGMKLLLKSYEESFKAVRTEAKYVADSGNSDSLLTPLEGAQ